MAEKSLIKILAAVGVGFIAIIVGGLIFLNQAANNFYQPPKNLEINWYPSSITTEEGQTIETIQGNFIGESDNFMRREILTPWEDMNGIEDQDMFSRCGSGAYYSVKQGEAGDPYYYGSITISKGCRPGPNLDFRITKKSPSIEILDSSTKNYVQAKDWLKTAKPIDWDNLTVEGPKG